MIVLFDANVILDILLKREPTFEDSYNSITLSLKNNDKCMISASSVADIYYILRKALKDKEKAKEKLERFLSIFSIATVDEKVIKNAFSVSGKDFEDDIVCSLAMASKCEYLVTNNISDFTQSENIKVLLPKDYIKVRQKS
ncbi:MAG: PIN domain-containing protein [Bacilli bacterium]